MINMSEWCALHGGPQCFGTVRALVDSGDGHSDGLRAILLDSGADAFDFSSKLGNSFAGFFRKTIVLRERVAISDRVQQPIICFGRVLESGWRINSAEQAS